jgi:hypothetical protein
MLERRRSRRRFLGQAGLVAGALVLGARRAGPARAAGDDLAALEAEMDGELVRPASAAYDELRRPASFNPRTNRRPAAIARCTSEADVSRALSFARERGLEVAVRSGGHDVLGASVCDDGLVIDLSGMKSIEIEAGSRTLRCGPGLRSGEVDRATQPFGLAAALGCNPVVGIAGLTLGGGIGWLAGKHGASCDNLVRARLVTATGGIEDASARKNPDLFWALRGGGGNFGIAVELEYRLHPVAQVFGGLLAFPVDRLREVLRVYRDLLAASPDELTMELTAQALARPLVMVVVCHAGERADGERAIAPLRRLSPAADTVGLVDYARLTERPGLAFALRTMGVAGTLTMVRRAIGRPPEFGCWRGGSIAALDDVAIADFADAVAAAPATWRVAIGHYMHGAICKPAEDTPLPRPPGASPTSSTPIGASRRRPTPRCRGSTRRGGGSGAARRRAMSTT